MNIEGFLSEFNRLKDSGFMEGIEIKWSRGKPILIDSYTKEELSPKMTYGEMVKWMQAFEAGYKWALSHYPQGR